MKDRENMEGLWKSSRRYLLIAAFGILLYEAIENLSVVRDALGTFFGIISPILIGVAIAFIANMPMRFFETKLFRRWKPSKLKRGICLAMAMLLVFAVISTFVIIIVPRLTESIKSIAENFDSYTASLYKWGNDMWERLNFNRDVEKRIEESFEAFMGQVDELLSDIVSWVFKTTISMVKVVISLIFSVIISVHVLYNKEDLARQSRGFINAGFRKNTAETILAVSHRTGTALNRYVYGTIMECLILGALCFVAMKIMGFPFALLISVIVGMFQLVPIVGAWVSAGICTLLILVVDPPKALYFCIMLIAVQQLEGNLIYPKVVGDAVGISGMWVLIAVLLGGGLFGIVGAILCVPVMAVLYTLLSEWVNRRLAEKREDNK